MANDDRSLERDETLSVGVVEVAAVTSDEGLLNDLIAALGFNPDKVGTAKKGEALTLLRQNGSSIGINTEPAFEEGPHLKGENLKLKTAQVQAAGITKDDERLTGQMRKMVEG